MKEEVTMPRRDEELEDFEDFADEEPLNSWAAIRRFLRSIARQVKKLNTDVYVGADTQNPSVTTRLDRIERSLSLQYKVTWAFGTLAVAALFGTIGQIIVKVIK